MRIWSRAFLRHDVERPGGDRDLGGEPEGGGVAVRTKVRVVGLSQIHAQRLMPCAECGNASLTNTIEQGNGVQLRKGVPLQMCTPEYKTVCALRINRPTRD